MKGIVLMLCLVAGVHSWSFWRGSPRVEPHEDVDQACRQAAAQGNCEFYRCLERRFPCGHDGYATKIGLHFCARADELHSQFTPQGKLFMNGSKTCVTSTLLPVYESYSARCDDIEDAGADAMRTCSYNEYAGMSSCTFIRSNMDVYNQMLGTDEVSRLMGLGNARLLFRIFVDGARCGATVASERFTSLGGSIMGSVGDLADGVSNWWRNL
ncbi:uncharacterized protein LOC128227037 [Mya arenaria]|uniref:uncharacterized protein LOC128227014 n=1 Tax=Mya arenaria TaxID=6604 RepID=UPI0022E3C44F|nr:uncharacterized protein LOC128227014 [Mya arenaria]XP_052793174.1 uncharacterized protein LOC128227037 [Mya arenaria]